MFGCCGVTDDKIHFGVPVSNQQNKFSLRLIKMQCCECVKQRSVKVLFQGGMLPDPTSRAPAGDERRFWAENIN